MKIRAIILALALFLCASVSYATFFSEIFTTTDLKAWQPIGIHFVGPHTTQSACNPNPFLDYRMQVLFSGPNGDYIVPGFYDGDGNGGGTGNIWTVRFTPDVDGVWHYRAKFESGANIAVTDDIGIPCYFDGEAGSFTVEPRDPNAPGFYSKGRLTNDTMHSKVGGSITTDTFWSRDGGPWVLESSVVVKGEAKLIIASGSIIMFRPGTSLSANGGLITMKSQPSAGPTRFVPYTSGLLVSKSFYFKTMGDNKFWLKGGTDSPECFLAVDFSPHGGIFGALDYLAEHHVNSAYMILMNIGGDGNNVWPWVSKDDIWHYDIGKLRNWRIIFDYAMKKGIALHLLLNEGEPANKEVLGKIGLTIQRKLYYREMVARFGYLNAVQWNLCEEYDHHCAGCKLDINDVRSWADYINVIDPFDHAVTIHNWGTEEQAVREPGVTDGWSHFWGENRWGAVSYQYRPVPSNEPSYNEKMIQLRNYAENSGLKIPVGMDETHGCSSYDSNECGRHPTEHWYWVCGFTAVRKEQIWPIYLGGGNLEMILQGQPNQGGIPTESYNFSPWEQYWNEMWYARKFVEDHKFWDLGPMNHRLSNGKTGKELLFANGHDYLVYLPYGGSVDLDLKTPADFTVRWYNPRTGEYTGTPYTVQGPSIISLYSPDDNDWAISLVEAEKENGK